MTGYCGTKDRNGCNQLYARKVVGQLRQAGDGNHFHIRHQGGFVGIVHGSFCYLWLSDFRGLGDLGNLALA